VNFTVLYVIDFHQLFYVNERDLVLLQRKIMSCKANYLFKDEEQTALFIDPGRTAL
jgi:hypothetical protein